MNPAKRKKFYRLSLKTETQQPIVVPEQKEEVKLEPKKDIKDESSQALEEKVETSAEEKTSDTMTATVAKKKKVVNEPV